MEEPNPEDGSKKSLKSVRGQPKKAPVPVATPLGPSTDAEKEETYGPKDPVPSKNIISVWKCRECSFLNKFGESSECGNSKKCNYDL